MNSIDYFEFNVTARHRAVALNDESLLSLVQKKMLPVVERVLDELGDPSKDLMISNLSLNLGDLTPYDFERNLDTILYQQLKQSVLEHLADAKVTEAQECNWLDTLFRRKNKATSIDLWKTFSKDLPQHYRDQLLELLSSQENRHFVALHLPDFVVYDMIASLEPTNSPFIIQMIQQYKRLQTAAALKGSLAAKDAGLGSDSFSNLQRQAESVAKPTYTDEILRQQIIELSLSYLAADRGGYFNRRSYLRSVISQMAAHNNQSITALCQNIECTLNSLEGVDQDIKQELLAVVSFGLNTPKMSASTMNASTVNTPKMNALQVNADEALRGNGFSIHPQWHEDIERLCGFSTRSHLRKSELVKIFTKALNENTSVLRSLLVKRATDTAFLSLLCSALPEALLYRVLALITDPHFIGISKSVDALKLTLSKAGFINDNTSLNVIFWQSLFTYVLRNTTSSTDFNDSTFIKGLIHVCVEVSHKYSGVRKSDIVDRLHQACSLQSHLSPQFTALSAVLLKFSPATASPATASYSVPTLDQYQNNPKAQADWLEQVVNAIAQGSWGFSEPLWGELKARSSGLLKSKLRRALLQQVSRSLFIARLGSVQQLEVIHLLSVDGYEMVKPVWMDDIALHPNDKVVANPSQYGTVVKEFALAYLVHDRGSEFNRKSFARGLLKQLAAHYNLSHSQLLDHLLMHTAVGGESLGIKTILNQIFDTDVPINRSKQAQGQAQDERGALVHREGVGKPELGTALYYRLVKILNSPSEITKETWSSVLQRLATHYPALMVRFVRELQRGLWDLTSITKKLTEPSVHILLDCILTVTGHYNASDGSSLALAIKRFASRSATPLRFYIESMQMVLAGGLIDLEQVERSTKNHATLVSVNGTSDNKISTVANAESVRSLAGSMRKHDERAPSQAHAISRLSYVDRSEQALAEFLRLPESQQYAYYMAADASKTRILWPYITFLRNALLGTDVRFQYSLFNHWVCKSLLEQILWPSLPISIDRCIQRHLHGLFTHLQANNNGHKWSLIQPQLIAHLFTASSAATSALGSQTAEKLRAVLASVTEVDVLAQSALVAAGVDLTDKALHKIETLQHKAEPASSSQAVEIITNRKASESTVEALNTSEGIAVNNAGIIAIAPYIPMLFEKLKLISNQAFINEASRLKAMAALHYLVFAEPLYQSSTIVGCGLTKLLCGLDINTPVEDSTILDHEEQMMCDSLLQGVIGHWSALGKTTVDGLREIFFRREGVMTLDEEKGWQLQVNTRSFDVLLDRIPWSYSTVKYQFMKSVIHVEWR